MALIVNATGPRDAKIAIVGMAPEKHEIAQGIPFVGPSGQMLDKALRSLNVKRESIFITNVHDRFLASGSSLFSLPPAELQNSLARLRMELSSINPNVVIPMGAEPLHFLCNLNGIQKWRGSILNSSLIPGQKCVPTVHPAWIMRGMWKWEPVFTHVDLARAVAESATSEISYPNRHAIIAPSVNTCLDYIEECGKHDILSVDIEVFGYSKTGTGEIACVGLGYKSDEALCIPFTRSGGQNYFSYIDESRVWQAIARLLQRRDIRKVGQNLAFEWIYFWLHSIFPANMHIDTMLLHHTLYPDFGGTEDIYGGKRAGDEPGHSLAFINSQYNRDKYYKDDGRRYIPGTADQQFWRYNATDVMVTLDAGLQMEREARENNLWDFYCDFKQRPFYHACRMEWYGVGIDLARRAEAGRELTSTIEELQGKINSKLGYELNVNSPKQLGELLYEKRGYKEVKKWRKSKKEGRVRTRSSDKDVIRKFAEATGDEVLQWVLDLRHARDLKGDIVEQKLGPDNRMHTHYKLGGTDTNRWSSAKSILGTGTNLQNVPRDGVARHLFIPS